MKAYLITTGLVFTLIALAHTWEVLDRRHLFVSDVVVFGVSAGLALWAWRLTRAHRNA